MPETQIKQYPTPVSMYMSYKLYEAKSGVVSRVSENLPDLLAGQKQNTFIFNM